MTVKATIVAGRVVTDSPIEAADGTPVTLIIAPESEQLAEAASGETLGDRLMQFAGKAVGFPPDAAENHDHYLYGVPKKK